MENQILDNIEEKPKAIYSFKYQFTILNILSILIFIISFFWSLLSGIGNEYFPNWLIFIVISGGLGIILLVDLFVQHLLGGNKLRVYVTEIIIILLTIGFMYFG